MEVEYKTGKIILNRVLSQLDEFVIDFVKILDKHKIRYVIVSGYVSIVFGRTRQTEDVDMLVKEMTYQEFEVFWNEITKDFECMNTDDPEDGYKNFLKEKTALRFFKKDFPFPNMEFKIASGEHDFESMTNSIKLILSENQIVISPLEMQIAFKMHLGSEKDYRDAKHIYDVFKDYLDKEKLKLLLTKFDNINKSKTKEYLSGLYA